MSLKDKLTRFASAANFRGKGPLCVALVVTEHARKFGFPLDPKTLLTERGGQVLGLGKGAVQAVLKKYGIDRVLAEEGGRTSRGSIDNMKEYVSLLNDLNESGEPDLDAIEAFWIERVKEFFGKKPFRIKVDAAESVQSIVTNLISQATKRQREFPGTMYAGAVMQHLVGAKLEFLHPGRLMHNSSSTSDATRAGDFEIGDSVIHVSISPGEALMRKCISNLEGGMKPIVISYLDRVAVAQTLAEQCGIRERVDVLDLTQFLSSNLHELGKFTQEGRRTHLEILLKKYNEIVSSVETDPSLKIEITKWG